MTDLKACPFCGDGAPKIIVKRDPPYLDIHVECMQCYARSAEYSANVSDEEAAMDNIDDSRQRAIDGWNRRARDDG